MHEVLSLSFLEIALEVACLDEAMRQTEDHARRARLVFPTIDIGV